MINECVFELVRRIPRGRVSTYKDIASKLKSRAYRAVGQILKNNPMPVKVPCHRVVCSDGRIGGYLGSHTNRKVRLLRREGVEIKNNRILGFDRVRIKL